MADFFIADHWTALTLDNAAEWERLAPHFLPKEIASKGDGSLKVEKAALVKLEALRNLYGAGIIVDSGYRDFVHNRRVGGSSKSQHVAGRAFDIRISDVEMGRVLEDLAIKVGFTAIGRYKTFIHVDNRPPKLNGGGYRWGSWA